MRYTAFLMAAIGKVAASPLGRPPSAQSFKGLKAQNRGLQTNSSPVYKTQLESSVVPKAPPNGLDRGISKPRRLSTGAGMKPVKTLEDVADLLKAEVVKNIVVMAGAGISTPSGIPDFRTPGTGLYDNLQQYRIPYPEAIFDVDYFHHNPKPFFTLAKELYPSGKYRPNYIHYFLRMLNDKGMLLRMYTQNIDGLERLAGLPPDKLVEAHGTFSSATCTICGSKKEEAEVKEAIFKDRLPKCNKRGCPGIVKPDIVFFGEDLPQRFYLYLRDMLQTDLVIVMGTSLEVQPFAGIIDTVKYGVPRVLFNWNAVGPFRSGKRSQDVVATGDLISSVQKFADMVGWKTQIEELITQQEGIFIVCSPEYKKQLANRQKLNSARAQPSSNGNWRNQYESSSSEESSESESESSSNSSDDDIDQYKKESFRRRGVRSTGSMKNNMGIATVKNGAGSNRLLNDIKKNGTSNTNGQKREFTTRVLSTRSPAPNSTSTARSDKYVSGKNSVIATRPPTGKFVNGKVSPVKPVDKTKASPEKLAPISNNTKSSSDTTTVIIGNITVVSDSKVSSTDTLNVLPDVKPSFKDTNNQISCSDKTNTSNNKTEILIDKAMDLSDSVVPSLARTDKIDKSSNSTEKSEKSIETVFVSNTNAGNSNTPLQIPSENLTQGIEHLTLSEMCVSDIDEKCNISEVKQVSTKNLNEVKKFQMKETLLTTRSESNEFSARRLHPVSSEIKNNKNEKLPINTVKSDSALSSMSTAKGTSPGSGKYGNTSSAKIGKEKNLEKFKRSKSEKNLRKKDKGDKNRSASAKAKINLKLIHDRYAKHGKVDTSPLKVSGKPNEIDSADLNTGISDQPYIDLIGTLKREKPLDFDQTIIQLAKCKITEDQHLGEITQNESNQETCNEDEKSKQLIDLSLKHSLPDENHVCSDSEKSTSRHRRRHRRKYRKKRLEKELNKLNPVPYGYATPRIKRLTTRAMIPANVCSGYELPSDYITPELLRNFSSAGHVKLSYRHSITSSPAVGTRVIVREDSSHSEIAEKPVDIC